ncbi:MAG: TonB-dependent receptor [bacterium]
MLKKSFPTLKAFIFTLFIIICSGNIFAGTTGKIAGKVTDENGEPVIGANVIVEGTYLGAAADVDGYYYINNVSPGMHNIIVSAVGYHKTTVQKVSVKIDLTTKIDIQLKSTAFQLGSDIVVQAQRPLVQKDLTSTSATVNSGEIKLMPVESVGQLINLQAGVVGGHFRGGRSNEVAYLVDGVSVSDAFNGGLTLEVENSSIRQMEVITGTFNAEYGQAMSGVVNIVTQEGSNKTEGYVSGYVGNNFTSNTDIFQNLDKFDRVPIRDITFYLSGPIPLLSNLTYFFTGRYFENDGNLYGKRVYNVNDDVPIYPNPSDKSVWIPQNTGNNEYVSMNPYKKFSFNTKITYSLPEFKFSYSLFWDQTKAKYYDHAYKWTPDGIMTHQKTDVVNSLQITNFISQSTYHSLKMSANVHNFWGNLYADPYDPRYVNPSRGTAPTNYTFRSGGNQGNRYDRKTLTYVVQYSLTSQISKEHKMGFGVEAQLHDLYNHGRDLINFTDGVLDSNGVEIFTPGYPNVGTITDAGSNTEYRKKPYEIAAYIQDKMEYDIMIINAGVRLDYFNPNSSLPADLRNPSNNPNFPGAGQFRKADDKIQISPRLGASFPITENGIIRFSYGHFFQRPDLENLYINPDFIVRPGISLNSITGNPDLKPMKTIQYEIGLQQVLFDNYALNLVVYYRDIRNLLGMEIINTYEGIAYARFVNRDYGNVKGFILTFDKRFTDFFSAKIDYTYQIAEGNASDPYTVFNNNQTDPPIETTKKVLPLNWDQRSTLNFALTIGDPIDWSVGLIFKYGSGFPYTEDSKVSQGVRFENGGIKPATFDLDLRAEKNFKIGNYFVNTYLLIYNVLDIKNETGVYATTGRATNDLNTKTAGDIVGLNTMQEFINNPSMYSSPREIRLGFGFGF